VQDPIETKIHPRRKLRMQSSSQAGESSSTQPLKCRVRGNPGTHRDGNAEGQRLGATLKASRRRSREGEEPGRPGEPNFGTAGRSREPRGNQGRIDQRRYRSSEETGQPGDSNTVARKGERFEETR